MVQSPRNGAAGQALAAARTLAGERRAYEAPHGFEDEV